MRAHQIENGIVTNTIEVESLDFLPNLVNGENGGAIGDRYENGEFIKPEPPKLSPEELQAEIVTATQQRLDDFAATRNYSSILSACTYATSTVPRFQSDGQYCVNARDATWAKLYTILDEVQAGARPVPTGFHDVASDLPVLEWPA
jgi:hypothetical protein